MATINACGNGLSGTTGTGNYVGANTPTLITPVLGAATATSVNFGGSSLSAYVATTAFSPTLTCSGTAFTSVTYNTNQGQYIKIGSLVFYTIEISLATFVLGLGTGDVVLSGLPFTPLSSNGWIGSILTFNITPSVSTIGLTTFIGASASMIIEQMTSGSTPVHLPIGTVQTNSTFIASGFYYAT